MRTQARADFMGKPNRRFGHLKAIAFIVGLVAITWVAVRTWLLNWGVAGAEAERTLPGDELVPNPSTQATMGVKIERPPEQVWPWIIQMGVDRAGFYTYLFVENTLLRLGATNADRIHPEWQDLRVGDHIWFVPEDHPTRRFGPVVSAIDPNQSLVLILGEPDKPAPGTWQFLLERCAGDTTRLLFRQRSSADMPLAVRLPNLLMEPGYFVMSRKMLLGIKQRAEGRHLARS